MEYFKKLRYVCPQWRNYNGSFDISGYQIDHIIELRYGGTNDRSNLQALCPGCHATKTNNENTKNISNVKSKTKQRSVSQATKN